MSTTVIPGKPSCLAAACLLVAFQSGCTSALTTAYLREGLWAGSEHASSTGDDATSPRDDAHGPHGEPAPIAPAPKVDRERREAALEEAMSRLSHLGPLDPAVEAALVTTLQRTQPEDWPVVVEEFAASLATTPVAAPAATPEKVAGGRADDEPRSAAPSETAPATAAPSAVTETASSAGDAAPAVQADAVGPADPVPPPAPAEATSSAPEPPLAVRSACFASAVRAWGDVDRFAADRFHPGQDVIVYVELDNLSAGASPAGHTTCIDAVLRLVDDAGTTLHTWSFDPIAETSLTRRRDYFARYVVHVPDTVPAGQCRVEVDVIDTRSGSTASTAIPLEIAAAR